MSDVLANVQEGDTIAIRFQGLWQAATVERVQDRFVYAKGIKFVRESGKESGVVIHPAYAVPMTQEIIDLIDKRHIVAELSTADWTSLPAHLLREIHDFIFTHLAESLPEGFKHG